MVCRGKYNGEEKIYGKIQSDLEEAGGTMGFYPTEDMILSVGPCGSRSTEDHRLIFMVVTVEASKSQKEWLHDA